VSVIAGVLGRAGERGQERRTADANRGVCTWRNQADIEKWMLDEKAKKAKEMMAQKEAERPHGQGGERRMRQ
jgi:hypothetical protein